MATEVPVSNVLCEAMEYLSKLGSNLRSRSENLREKRIRKDKLTNSHAIQKAAQKVLLICELSKKSLDNVEVGVRKILSHVKANQLSTDVGGKSYSPHVRDSSHYQYFDFETYKLKVSKKVQLKHFLSSKVVIQPILKSTLHKYPVYYKCKLFKLRKCMEHERSGMKVSSSLDSAISENKNGQERNPLDVNVYNKISMDDEEKSECSQVNKNDLNDCNITAVNNSKTMHNSIECKDVTDTSLKLSSECTNTSSNLKDDVEASPKINENVNLENNELKNGESIKQPSSSDTEKEHEKNKERDRKIENSRKNSHKKKYRHIKIIDVTSSSDEDDNSKAIDNKDSGMMKKENNNENQAIDRKVNVQTDEVQEQSDQIDTTQENETESGTKPNKPLIKCVSMTKLLKPEVLDSVVTNIRFKDNAKNTSVTKSSRDKHINKVTSNENRNKFQRSHTKALSQEKDTSDTEEFWKEKRKEVSLFKPKLFTVNISRLPELTEMYLKTHNLRRITKSGNVLIELQEQLEKVTDMETLKKLKNDLLNDSDSEKDNTPVKEVTNAKHALLNDSDSDTEKNMENLKTNSEICEKEDRGPVINTNSTKGQETVNETSESEKCKRLLIRNSDSDHSDGGNDSTSNRTFPVEAEQASQLENIEDTSKRKSEDVKVVSSQKETIQTEDSKLVQGDIKQACEEGCLSHSSDTSSKSPKKKKKRTKRKHAAESEKAKNMLMYSSSSENEDDKLKNTIKEIEDSLLRVIKSGMQKEDSKCQKSSDSSNSSSMENKNNRLKSNCHTKRRMSRISSKESDDNSQSTEVDTKASRHKMVRSKALPSSSSGHNSDSPDSNTKDVDGLTNFKNLNKVRRRRLDSSTQDGEEMEKSVSMPKTSPVDLGAEVEILAVDTSSDEASANEGNDEEIPMMSVPSLNGDGVGHMAKDDLLGESDSSVSPNDKDKPGDESEEENVKKRRRKANTISSDSEVGSSRQKERHRVSDFEDSEEDTSEPIKRSKRKKKGSDSDASGSASSNDDGKKKRRRIKQVDSDEMSGSDTENEGRNKHGRKNIRKVMGKNQLEEATKKAAREEKERIARIMERQKLYNNMEFDESGKPDEVVLEKVVLDFDPETKEPLIEVDRGLVKKLKPHQANGIKFMWDACFESVKRIKKDKGSGCILAHCMGLGKTLQVVSLTHTLLIHGDLTGVNRVLVVCPLSTVLNWVNEFRMWLKHAETEYEVDVYELSRFKQNSERAYQLQQWTQGGGVCVLGYEMFRNLSADNPKKFKKKMLKSFQEALVDPGPDLVVCDEGHLLKNEKTSLSQSMNRVKTLRRIVLTGTPLQNNLKEYYCMVQFVKPNLLGKYNEYLNRFVNPITNGQYTDSTEHDIRVMKRRSHVLHKMLDGAVQRRDYGVLAPFLPPKHEYVLFITLTEVQIKLYQFYLDNYSRRPQPGKSSGFLFPDFQSLQRIWTHPLVLKYNSERYEIMQQKKREREEEDSEGSLVDFIDDDSTPDESSTEDSTDDSSELSDDSRKKSKKKKTAKKGKGNSKVATRRGTRANPIELDDDIKEETVEESRNENPTEWWIKLVEEEELEDLRNSHKLLLLFNILRQCEAIGDKLLVFSQSLYSLDLIEHFLGKVDEATQEGRIDEKLASHVGSWSPGVDYFRLDGSTSCENRSIWCKNFNREDNPRARLFLISTRAGGLGINLVAANRVVIFDVSWNPSHDVQSIFRVYRFGQKKPCYVYRFLAMGTMEEKIYERQVTKQAISKRVIDEQQIDRHYAENDLAELYKFEPHPPTPRPLPPLPKDRLFAEMLKEHEAQIYKYHEHDSLLENKEEETLTEEERKAAWEDFENEKNRPPPAPFPSAWPMHNGMFPGLIQQQQLAYAALAAMMRKEMPNMNENQLRDMLPFLYNTNPGLVQKVSELYKYTNMMNPMMNTMNPAAGDAGLGGSSGLHYEPPWQRQQQQQHQNRLQQLLMQQQNQMGAKYYAGGLGSRDPVAMAMQQQRAREIMMDPQARRPRGRPPMQPRMPTAPGDVVNLDSD